MDKFRFGLIGDGLYEKRIEEAVLPKALTEN
jgi:hypothetical protein